MKQEDKKPTQSSAASKTKAPEFESSTEASIVMCTHCGSDNVIPFVEGSNDYSCNYCQTEFSIN